MSELHSLTSADSWALYVIMTDWDDKKYTVPRYELEIATYNSSFWTNSGNRDVSGAFSRKLSFLDKLRKPERRGASKRDIVMSIITDL
jgi:hypothetical protein